MSQKTFYLVHVIYQESLVFTFFMRRFIHDCYIMFSGHFMQAFSRQPQKEVLKTSQGGLTYDVFFLQPPKDVFRTYSFSPGAKGLKWRFFDHESEQAEFGLKLCSMS